jgi:hypothetical protein
MPPDDLRRFPLLDALRLRRSRRFARGLAMPEGPLAYRSEHRPEPLTDEEEALLAVLDDPGGPAARRPRGVRSKSRGPPPQRPRLRPAGYGAALGAAHPRRRHAGAGGDAPESGPDGGGHGPRRIPLVRHARIRLVRGPGLPHGKHAGDALPRRRQAPGPAGSARGKGLAGALPDRPGARWRSPPPGHVTSVLRLDGRCRAPRRRPEVWGARVLP